MANSLLKTLAKFWQHNGRIWPKKPKNQPSEQCIKLIEKSAKITRMANAYSTTISTNCYVSKTTCPYIS